MVYLAVPSVVSIVHSATKVWNMWKIFLAVTLFVAAGKANECVPRSFGAGRIVCVCNATYCDSLSEQDQQVPSNGTAYWFVSNKEGLRLDRSQLQFGTCATSAFDVRFHIDVTQTYQTIFGFGGAFTDSVGINLKKLSNETQDQLLRTYYSKSGSAYSVSRIPAGGTDFSTRVYTYDDVEDDTLLQHFALAPEDYEYKIPYIKRALELNPDLKFVSASWSAPPWMKTNDKINGFGFLKRDYYQLYADYLLKFLQAYKKNGIDIWGITTGNEPFNTYMPFDVLNTMGWTPTSMATWVADNLGPTLANSDCNDTLILALDDQRFNLPWYVDSVLNNEEAKKYIAGTAIHWYGDMVAPPEVLAQTHFDFPDKFMLMTEACSGFLPTDEKVVLGSWERGAQYFESILEYMENYVCGWVDWNLALDENGGPNWINNFVDAAIIVNFESDEFYKQPMYYALNHVSRFVVRNSTRVYITNRHSVKAVAFVTPSNETVILLHNRNHFEQHVTIHDPNNGDLCLVVSPNSINTIKYKL